MKNNKVILKEKSGSYKKQPLPGGFVMRINFIYQGQYAGSVMAGLAAPVANNLITTEPLVLLPELGVARCKECRSSGLDAASHPRIVPGYYVSDRGGCVLGWVLKSKRAPGELGFQDKEGDYCVFIPWDEGFFFRCLYH